MPPKKKQSKSKQYRSTTTTKKTSSSKKGMASKTHKGDKDYTTKRGDKDFHRKGHDVKKKRKPFSNKETKATRAKISKGTAELGGEKITFRKGGLHRSLKVPTSYKFKKNELERINRIPDGKSFKFHDDNIKMTPKIHKQLTLGLNLMKRKK